MKILVTGHKGFIGSNMVKALATNHEISTYEWGDELPPIKGLDWVMHIGAISSTTERNIEKIMAQNVDSSVWFLQECAKHNVNLQYSSSASVYGQRQQFKETSPLDHACVNSKRKLASLFSSKLLALSVLLIEISICDRLCPSVL